VSLTYSTMYISHPWRIYAARFNNNNNNNIMTMMNLLAFFSSYFQGSMCIFWLLKMTLYIFWKSYESKSRKKTWTNIFYLSYLSLLPCCHHQSNSASLHVDTKENRIVFFFKASKLSLHHALSYNNKLSEWLTSSLTFTLFFFRPYTYNIPNCVNIAVMEGAASYM